MINHIVRDGNGTILGAGPALLSMYPHDRLVTSEGWRRLGEWGIMNGYVGYFHELVLESLILMWIAVLWQLGMKMNSGPTVGSRNMRSTTSTQLRPRSTHVRCP